MSDRLNKGALLAITKPSPPLIKDGGRASPVEILGSVVIVGAVSYTHLTLPTILLV